MYKLTTKAYEVLRTTNTIEQDIAFYERAINHPSSISPSALYRFIAERDILVKMLKIIQEAKHA